MQQPDVTPQAQRPAISLEAVEAQYHQSMQAYAKLLEKGTPWLSEMGSWIFGGLIAFNLLVMAALITIGPVDIAIKVAAAALAVALPLDVTGLILLRLAKDIKPGGFETTITQTLQDSGLTPGALEVPSLTAIQALRIRGTQIALRYAFVILSLSAIFSLGGLAAALWHMAWWIAAAFLVTMIICLGAALVAVAAAQPRATAEQRAQRKAYRDELLRQAKEQTAQAKALAKQARRR